MSFDASYTPSLSPTATAKSSDTFGRSLLSPSISSFSSPAAQRQTSHISKTYRQASTLFLTRRLPEALSTLLPLITPPSEGEPTPVSGASRTTRVKVWSLYLTTLNAIVEMEPEEGKSAFGTQEWRALCAKVREGTVWEEVVRNGYHGSEGDVDSEVVINLATLLLAHAQNQTLNQKKLETYLATCTAPNLDFGNRLNGGRSPGPRMSRYASPAKGTSGTDTPRDLNARVKILELYTLHVLLRNNEWDYAREFISVSAVLDDERREAFLQALQSLQEEQQEKERQEREERQRQEDQLRRDIEEARRLREASEERERRRLDEEKARKEASETDYGVDQTPSPSPRRAAARPSSGSISRPAGGRSGATQTPTLTARASMVFNRLKIAIEQIAETLNSNPVIVLRLLGFIVSLLIMLGHKGLRQRLQRMLGASWAKVAATAGMGTKVSYI
ncbi:hypothetical protein NLG97_g6848 [Lecanicillium saksenae]|uniref:Uncharacterized protein n=1 Tax=Lecanicillium saksenae TaxID=468837 RepID=A0ACC1QS99_9HYPO|nr:hypothetical protein NLG97_g6848 [Lecanicillium saksenae]